MRVRDVEIKANSGVLGLQRLNMAVIAKLINSHIGHEQPKGLV